jgi:putative membrane protein
MNLAPAKLREGYAMKNLAQTFLTEEEHLRIDAAIKTAEDRTSGEIVCMIQSASYHYPVSNVLGAATLALPSALVLTPAVGGHLWLGTQNMWLFLGLFALIFATGYLLVQKWPSLKRCFISIREMDEEVEEAAVTRFFRHGLHQTRDATGILIFISVFEHKVWILADRGIDAKLDQGTWDGIVQVITDGIRNSRPADAICEAVEQVGNMLEEHFPIRSDDQNELRNVIIADDD